MSVIPQESLDAAAAEIGRQVHGGPADPDDIRMASDVLLAAKLPGLPARGPLTPAQCWAQLQAMLVTEAADFREARDNYARSGDTEGERRAIHKGQVVSLVLDYMDELERQS